MYDSIVITWIGVVDTLGVWLMWKMLQERQRTRIRRVVNHALKAMHLEVRV